MKLKQNKIKSKKAVSKCIPLISSRLLLLIIINWLATGCSAVRQEQQKAPLPMTLASNAELVPESKPALQLIASPSNVTMDKPEIVAQEKPKEFNSTFSSSISSLVKQSMANVTAGGSSVTVLMAQKKYDNATVVRRVDKQQETIEKLKTAQSKQDNQDKLYY